MCSLNMTAAGSNNSDYEEWIPDYNAQTGPGFSKGNGVPDSGKL